MTWRFLLLKNVTLIPAVNENPARSRSKFKTTQLNQTHYRIIDLKLFFKHRRSGRLINMLK